MTTWAIVNYEHLFKCSFCGDNGQTHILDNGNNWDVLVMGEEEKTFNNKPIGDQPQASKSRYVLPNQLPILKILTRLPFCI